MTESVTSSQVIFFLGAGASVAAGVPATVSFVEKFIESVRDEQKRNTIIEIVRILSEHVGSRKEVDVELLLETLEKLDRKDQEVLLKFFRIKEFILTGYSEKAPLIKDLKKFIKKKTIVKEDSVRYIEPLLSFVEDYRPLDVISVNYDICIEQFCNLHKLSHQDGFNLYWDAKSFETEHTDIRLYKLHGSATWYKSDRGNYLKLPIMSDEPSLTLITGEVAESLMLYPVQKWDYSEPFLELLIRVKQVLESENCKFVIVVGYSFRDDHIKRILWDAAIRNKLFRLILVAPNSYQIYEETLKHYPNNSIPSSLCDRVLCLPYKFEKVFPRLKNMYLKSINEALSLESEQQHNERMGVVTDWVPCLRKYTEAEYLDKMLSIENKLAEDEIRKDWELCIDLPFVQTFAYLSQSRRDKAVEAFGQLVAVLEELMTGGISIQVLSDGNMGITFDWDSFYTGSVRLTAKQVRDKLRKLETTVKTRSADFELDASLIEALQLFGKLKSYLVRLMSGNFQRYLGIRKRELDIQKLSRDFAEAIGQPEKLHEVNLTINAAEKNILNKVFESLPNDFHPLPLE